MLAMLYGALGAYFVAQGVRLSTGKERKVARGLFTGTAGTLILLFVAYDIFTWGNPASTGLRAALGVLVGALVGAKSPLEPWRLTTHNPRLTPVAALLLGVVGAYAANVYGLEGWGVPAVAVFIAFVSWALMRLYWRL